jgi:hypothetical protein
MLNLPNVVRFICTNKKRRRRRRPRPDEMADLVGQPLALGFPVVRQFGRLGCTLAVSSIHFFQLSSTPGGASFEDAAVVEEKLRLVLFLQPGTRGCSDAVGSSARSCR